MRFMFFYPLLLFFLLSIVGSALVRATYLCLPKKQIWSDNQHVLFLTNNPTGSVKVKATVRSPDFTLWVCCRGVLWIRNKPKVGILQLCIASHDSKGSKIIWNSTAWSRDQKIDPKDKRSYIMSVSPTFFLSFRFACDFFIQSKLFFRPFILRRILQHDPQVGNHQFREILFSSHVLAVTRGVEMYKHKCNMFEGKLYILYKIMALCTLKWE